MGLKSFQPPKDHTSSPLKETARPSSPKTDSPINSPSGVDGKIAKYEDPEIIDDDLVPTVFRWKEPANNVGIIGSFNNWETVIPLLFDNDEFMMIINIPLGEHRYKFLVDNEWRFDNTIEIARTTLEVLNVIRVLKSDLDVRQALASDYEEQNLETKKFKFGHDVPPASFYYKPGPTKDKMIEIYPKTSLHCLLNDEHDLVTLPKSLSCSDNAALNHLFVLGFNDNILASSVTQRFRNKFVTTIYHRLV